MSIDRTALHHAAARLAAAWLLPLCIALAGCAQPPRVLYEGQSPYNTLIVAEGSGGLRTLLFEHGGARQSVVDPADPTRLTTSFSWTPSTRAACRGT